MEAGYAPYERALRRGAFMRGLDGGAYLGWVWPGAVHYIDFLAASARHFFSELLAEHHALVPWSGLWIGGLPPMQPTRHPWIHISPTCYLGGSQIL